MISLNEQPAMVGPTSPAGQVLNCEFPDFGGWEKGYLHVYTGEGKGKTTAALGLAVRAVGNGARVFIGQFMKSGIFGEIRALQHLRPMVHIQQFGTGKFIRCGITEKDSKTFRKGILTIKNNMFSGDYHLVIIDEINTAVFHGLISVSDLLEIIKLKPAGVELVLTGRYAPPELIQSADLVTEMREIKHYYQSGVNARAAIEE